MHDIQPNRLALLTGLLSPSAGGLTTSVPGMARSIKEFEVHVIGLADPSAPHSFKSWGERVHAQSVIPPRALGFAPSLFGTLNRIAPAIIDAQGLWTYTSLACLRYHKRSGIPYVVTPRGMLDPWALKQSAQKKMIASLLFQHSHIRLASCLRSTSELEAQHIRSCGIGNPVAIIPNGVDIPALAEPNIHRDKKQVLFLSRLHPKKGLPFLLRAWARVWQQRLNWELLVVGPSEVGHFEDMQGLAERLKLKNVKWLSAVNPRERDAVYRDSHIFVLPTHGENFGNVVAEALAHGVPVITTRHAPWSGLTEKRCGWWIDLSVEHLAETLLKATSLPPEELAEMGKRGRDWMEAEYGWRQVALKLTSLYQWVLFGGTTPPFVYK